MTSGNNGTRSAGGWSLSDSGFDRLLSFLDRDRDRAAAAYELLRRKLIKFFDWRGHPDPEHLADLTLNRVARKLEEGTEVRSPNPASFVLGVARMVFLEESRRLARQDQVEPATLAEIPVDGDHQEEHELRLRALESCLEALDRQNRDLLLRYYAATGGPNIEIRKQISRELGISAGVLRLRAHRLRLRLEGCVTSRLGAADVKRFSSGGHSDVRASGQDRQW